MRGGRVTAAQTERYAELLRRFRYVAQMTGDKQIDQELGALDRLLTDSIRQQEPRRLHAAAQAAHPLRMLTHGVRR